MHEPGKVQTQWEEGLKQLIMLNWFPSFVILKKSEVKCDLLSAQMQQHLHGCFRPTQDVRRVRGQAH